jgi:hypothetical protein
VRLKKARIKYNYALQRDLFRQQPADIDHIFPVPFRLFIDSRVRWHFERSIIYERSGRPGAGRKMIEAIKLYREITGVGLKEAKDTIEAIDSNG